MSRDWDWTDEEEEQGRSGGWCAWESVLFRRGGSAAQALFGPSLVRLPLSSKQRRAVRGGVAIELGLVRTEAEGRIGGSLVYTGHQYT